VLDIATGTGIAAEAAAGIVGPAGKVFAADISPAMIELARRRVSHLAMVACAVQDGQALEFPDEDFDVVLCNMAFMLFPDPAKGLAEFHRVLRPGGCAAISVNTVSDRSFITRVATAIGRYEPSTAAIAAQYFSLGDASRLSVLFGSAGFTVSIHYEMFKVTVTSFATYFQPIEAGFGDMGARYTSLTPDLRHKVREDIRRELGSVADHDPVDVPVEVILAVGTK